MAPKRRVRRVSSSSEASESPRPKAKAKTDPKAKTKTDPKAKAKTAAKPVPSTPARSRTTATVQAVPLVLSAEAYKAALDEDFVMVPLLDHNTLTHYPIDLYLMSVRDAQLVVFLDICRVTVSNGYGWLSCPPHGPRNGLRLSNVPFTAVVDLGHTRVPSMFWLLTENNDCWFSIYDGNSIVTKQVTAYKLGWSTMTWADWYPPLC